MPTVLCFGDSNTYGTQAMTDFESRRRFAKAQRWPSVMGQVLGAAFEIIAEGQPGRTAAFDDPVEGAHKNGLRVLPALLESHSPIDFVVIMLGTNDLKARFGVPALDIALALERLVTCVRTSNAGPGGQAPGVLLVSPVPIAETGFLAEMFAGGAAKARTLPAHLERVAKRHGVAFLDLAPVAEVDMVDGIHLTAEAQAAIGQAIAAELRDLTR